MARTCQPPHVVNVPKTHEVVLPTQKHVGNPPPPPPGWTTPRQPEQNSACVGSLTVAVASMQPTGEALNSRRFLVQLGRPRPFFRRMITREEGVLRKMKVLSNSRTT